jgi:hypothetical protein
MDFFLVETTGIAYKHTGEVTCLEQRPYQRKVFRFKMGGLELKGEILMYIRNKERAETSGNQYCEVGERSESGSGCPNSLPNLHLDTEQWTQPSLVPSTQ